MKNSKFTLFRRSFAIVAVVVLLLTALSGCGGKAKVVKPTVNGDVFLTLDEGTSLTATELKAIATMLSATYATDFETQEMLIAAYRGYDMLAEGFKESEVDPTVTKEFNQAAVVNLIKKANEKAGTDSKIHFDTYTNMTAADTMMIIKSLQTTVDLDGAKGFWDTLFGWIGAFIGWMTRTLCFGSYIGGICLFAVIIELLMLPLSIKQQKNSIKQAKLRPKEMAIKKKYAGRNDQATQMKMREEMQELYQRENVNMASGCLPLLIQLPIVLVLYRIVVDPLRYVLGQVPALSTALHKFFTASPAAGGLGMSISDARGGTITILSELTPDNLAGLKDFLYYGNGQEMVETVESILPKMPDFTLGNINLGLNPSFDRFDVLLLVPVLTFIVYFLSMRLTKKFTYQPQAMQDQQTACSGWLMDIYMPGMSTFFAFMVPALLGIYWMFKSVISTLRQFIVCKIMPYPQFTEEDYRAAEREYMGRAPRKNDAPRQDTRTYGRDVQMVGGKPKSLFHMDDDDYVAKIEEEQKREAEEKGGSEKVEGVALKEYDRPERKKKNKETTKTDDGESSENQDQ
jgi:YidC/Oxa1 family membrane protein insertase